MIQARHVRRTHPQSQLAASDPLRVSYRDGDKIKKRTLANLSDWPEAKVEALRRVLRGDAVAPSSPEALVMRRSLLHGHVAAALGTVRKLGLDRLLSQGGRQRRRAVHRDDCGASDRACLQAGDRAPTRR